MTEKHLEIKWTISKARDSYGYNICTVWDKTKRYHCMGGGYDMLGTAFGNWLKENYKDRLDILASDPLTEYYGFTIYAGRDWRLDGACGLECMIKVAEAIGIDARPIYSARASCYIGFYIKEIA